MSRAARPFRRNEERSAVFLIWWMPARRQVADIATNPHAKMLVRSVVDTIKGVLERRPGLSGAASADQGKEGHNRAKSTGKLEFHLISAMLGAFSNCVSFVWGAEGWRTSV